MRSAVKRNITHRPIVDHVGKRKRGHALDQVKLKSGRGLNEERKGDGGTDKMR